MGMPVPRVYPRERLTTVPNFRLFGFAAFVTRGAIIAGFRGQNRRNYFYLRWREKVVYSPIKLNITHVFLCFCEWTLCRNLAQTWRETHGCSFFRTHPRHVWSPLIALDSPQRLPPDTILTDFSTLQKTLPVISSDPTSEPSPLGVGQLHTRWISYANYNNDNDNDKWHTMHDNNHTQDILT